jgi:hypothetical protein
MPCLTGLVRLTTNLCAFITSMTSDHADGTAHEWIPGGFAADHLSGLVCTWVDRIKSPKQTISVIGDDYSHILFVFFILSTMIGIGSVSFAVGIDPRHTAGLQGAAH